MARLPHNNPLLKKSYKQAPKKSSAGCTVMTLLGLAALGGGLYYAYEDMKKEAELAALAQDELKAAEESAKLKKEEARRKQRELLEKRKTKSDKKAQVSTEEEEPVSESQDVDTDAISQEESPVKLDEKIVFSDVEEAADNAKKKVKSVVVKKAPEIIRQALTKKDFRAVREVLLNSLKEEKISSKNKEHLHQVMLLEFIDETGAEVLNEFTQDKHKRQFINTFAQDAEWMEEYLSCGLVPYQTDVGINILYNIWNDQKGNVEKTGLAVALASVWGGGKTDPNPPIQQKNIKLCNPVWRYNFFVEQEEKGRLHPNYKNLKPWELRFVVGIPQQDWDDASYTWCIENINLPWDHYQSACWAAMYADTSKFGDSVQGGAYHMPYDHQGWAQATQLNGGVCGALSHLGTYAAMAHGIPAYTVGQPGHCAYAVRPERGKWVGGFGGPDGGMHNRIFGNEAPTSYLLMESVFGDDKGIKKAYRDSFCAKAMQDLGDLDGAKKLWNAALKDSPMHPFFRAELHQVMRDLGLDKDECFKYLKKALEEYKGNGFAAVDMAADLQDFINEMDDEQKVDIYQNMHNVMATTPNTWAVSCTDIVKEQSDSLKSDKAKQDFLKNTLAAHMHLGDGNTFGQVMEWAVAEYSSGDDSSAFGKAFASAARMRLGKRKKGDDGNNMGAAYGKAIISAEQARSAVAFQSVSKVARRTLKYKNNSKELPKPKELSGKSDTAILFRSSSTFNADEPLSHIDVISMKGGKCHTSKEEKPFFVVEIEKESYLSGCYIRKTDGNEGRMDKATVYTSVDGSSWMTKQSTDNMPKEWVVKLPPGTRAKFVKIEFDNSDSPDFAHLSHFVVFSR